MNSQSDLTDDEFLAVNRRSIARLRKKQPNRTDVELARALRQAQGSMEHSTSDRIITAASALLDKAAPGK
jgi:hypothetical protein